MIDIKKERDVRGMTQEEFANLLGVTRKTIVNYESGGNIPETKIRMFMKILSNNTQFKNNIKNTNNVSRSNDSPLFLNYEGINVPVNIVSDFIHDNWNELLNDRVFKATFEGKASEWLLMRREQLLKDTK